jgi:hypothetical protein
LRYVLTHTKRSKADTTQLMKDALGYMSPKDAKAVLRALKGETAGEPTPAGPAPTPIWN